MHRIGAAALTTTLLLGALMLIGTVIYATITPTVTPMLVAMATSSLALLQVGLLSRGRIDGVRETVDRLAAALRETKR